MPQVVHPRLVASTTVPPNACDRAQATECGADRCITQGPAIALGKQRALAAYGMVLLATSYDERPYHAVQTGAQGYDARLEELRTPDVYQRLRHVHVTELETQRFAAAQSGAAENVKALIDRGADVNARMERGTPLIFAAGGDRAGLADPAGGGCP